MSELNLNTHPYYDDFDESKHYQRILAIPGRAPQARELTQMQTIIQNQVRKLGDSLYKNGTVLRGCKLTINDSKTTATVSAGDVYVDGLVITFNESTTLAIQGTGTEVIGLKKYETIISEVDDITLRDPAQGYDNYNQPGANRLKVEWIWSVINPTDIDSIEVTYRLGIFTLFDGSTDQLPVEAPDITQQILDISAKRDYAKSGNYVLDGLKLKLLDHPDDPLNYKRLVVESGTARLQGYDTVLSTNKDIDIPVSRDAASVTSEPWICVPYDYSTLQGGVYRLSQRPVSSVTTVVATVLTCDGYGSNPSVVRGAISGGSDELSETSVESIIAVNYGGTWNPLSGVHGAFVGGITYVEGLDFLKDGNRIDWSPRGSEPPAGVNYKVAYTFRKTLTKQIYEKNQATFEAHIHGSDDILAHPYRCEMNDYTGATFTVANPVNNDLPSTILVNDYVENVDFVVNEDTGLLEWYDYEIQILTLTKSIGQVQIFSSLEDDFTFYQIIAAASYGEGDSYTFDPDTQTFVSAVTSYQQTTDYTYVPSTPSITWVETGTNPATNSVYYVAVLGRKYKTDNHPIVGHTYYVSYYYWLTRVGGDYIAKDSYYINWYSNSDSRNTLQHYGLDIGDYVNFWKSDTYNSNLGLMNKPYPNSLVEFDYDYSLAKYVVIEITKNDGINVIYGQASSYPTEPVFDDKVDSIMLGKIYLPPDSTQMYLTEFGVTTLKVLDLHNLRDRVLRTEINLADTWLDMDAKSIEVSNKKGISTSSFRTNDRFDLGWEDSNFSIDPDWEMLSFPHTDYFHYTEVDETQTTGAVYTTVCTLVPTGTETVSQNYYTAIESIAPFEGVSQASLQTSQAIYMNLYPSGDPLIIPSASADGTDGELWASSSLSYLTDPSVWFSGGWRGNQQDETSTTTTLTQSWSSEYVKGITGVCRRLSVIFDIPGGLAPVEGVDLDYFVYFGGVLVDIELLNGTPVGSVANTFKARSTDSGATGRFSIPKNIPSGSIEVKIISSPVQVNGTDWRVTISAIYNATVSQELTTVFNRCRCNCYGCNRCSNCWSCTGRCGTGPLSETLEAVGKNRILKSIEYDFYSTHPKYGVYGAIIKTDNGAPSSSSVANAMVARKFMSAAYLSGAGPKVCEFNDPVFLQDETYATVITAEDGFNLNSAQEITAARDIKVKVATIGQNDKVTNVTVGADPFQFGTFWRSITGYSWEQDLATDLKFNAIFNTYSTGTEQIVKLQEIEVYDATAFICTWNSVQMDGTYITFEYRTDQESWTEFAPYVLTQLSAVATTLEFRARIMTNLTDVTPLLEKFCGVYVQSSGTSMKAVTRLFTLASGEQADTLDIYLDSYLPTGCNQLLRVTFDNGATWIRLDQSDGGLVGGNVTVTSDSTVVDMNTESYTVRYHWKVVLGSGQYFSSYRTEITSQSTGSTPKLNIPRFSRYIAITSNS